MDSDPTVNTEIQKVDGSMRRGIFEATKGMRGNEAVWKQLGYPLVVLVEPREAELLDGPEKSRFFQIALNRIFNEDPLMEREKQILVVLHFRQNQGSDGKEVIAVRTHDLDMGGRAVDGVWVPAFLDWEHHGRPCELRSREDYPRITEDELWEVIGEQEGQVDRGVQRKDIPFPSEEMRSRCLTEMGLKI